MIYPVYLKSCDITGQHLQYLGSLKLVYKTDERYHALKISCKQLNFNTLMVRLYSKHKSSNNTSDLLLNNAWYCTNLFVKNENYAIMPFWFKNIVFVLKVFCSKWKKTFKCFCVMAHTVQLIHDAYGPVTCTLFYYHLNWQLIAIWEFYYSHDWLSIYIPITLSHSVHIYVT